MAVPTCMSHQIPIYFTGFIQLTSSITEGAFKFKMSFEAKISVALSLTTIVRQGVTQGVFIYTLLPTASGTNAADNVFVAASIRNCIAL